MTYRATPVTQRDGSPFANANCRMAAIATGIDFHTTGGTLSTGAEMRSRQSDQSGGTDSGDAAEAWETYGQDLRICDGLTWADAEADLEAGRLVHLDVWHATTGGPCLSGSGAYGHTLAVAPERSGTRWLVADPWCNPPKWIWWESALLRAGAEHLADLAMSGTMGPGDFRRDLVVARGRLAVKRLMTVYSPEAPAPVTALDTGGAAGGMIYYTTTRSPPTSEVTGLAINAAPHLATGIRAQVRKDVPFYSDPNLVNRLGAMAADSDVPFVGSPIGETVPGGSYAIQVMTGTAYSDGSVRPTVVYVRVADASTYSVPPPSGGPTDEELLEAKREGYDLAMSPFPPRP